MIRTMQDLAKYCEENKVEGGIMDPVPLLGGPQEAVRVLLAGELDEGLARVVSADMSTQSFLLMELIKLAESIEKIMKDIGELLRHPPYAEPPYQKEVAPSTKAKRKG